MRKHKKLVLSLVISSITVVGIGCGPMNEYQNSMFDDESKIVKESDSHTYKSRAENNINEDKSIKFSSFSGTETIYELDCNNENEEIVLNLKTSIDKGDFKIVLISPEDKVTDIVIGTNELNETFKLEKGTSRIKLVGKQSGGKIDIRIDVGEGVEIRHIDS